MQDDEQRPQPDKKTLLFLSFHILHQKVKSIPSFLLFSFLDLELDNHLTQLVGPAKGANTT
jgi:hypothetical protein